MTTMTDEELFVPASTKSRHSTKMRCTVCGRTGHPTYHRKGWMEDCRAGHPYKCNCGRLFATKAGQSRHLAYEAKLGKAAGVPSTHGPVDVSRETVIIRVASHRARETMHRVLGVKLKGHYRLTPGTKRITDGHDYYVLTPGQWELVKGIKSISEAPRTIRKEDLGKRWEM